jgi:hypothetical protein
MCRLFVTVKPGPKLEERGKGSKGKERRKEGGTSWEGAQERKEEENNNGVKERLRLMDGTRTSAGLLTDGGGNAKKRAQEKRK